MKELIKVVAKIGHTVHHYPNGKDKPQAVNTLADGVFGMSEDDYADLGPDGLNSVRPAKKDEVKELGETAAPAVPKTYSPAQVADMKSRHRGGGRWDVVLGEEVIEGNFESREDADANIVDRAAALEG